MTAGGPGDIADRLAALSALWKSGALTDAEFQEAKSRLLDGDRAPATAGGAGRPGRTMRFGSREVPVPIVIGAIIGAIVALVIVVSLVTRPGNLKSRAIGTWSCVDAGDSKGIDYIIGDGTYNIPQRRRHGTWSLTGTSLSIHEAIDYGDGHVLNGDAQVNLTSADRPTGATIEFASTESGYSDQAEGGAHVDGNTVTVHLQHGSRPGATDDVTCTKK